MSNIEQNAVRVLPPSLSYILLVYLVIIEPFQHFCVTKLGKKDQQRRHLLFYINESHLSSRQMTNRLRQRAEVYLHRGERSDERASYHRLGLSKWRHLALGFIRYSMQEMILDDPHAVEDGIDTTTEGLVSGQMHHTRHTAQYLYAREQGRGLFGLPGIHQQAFVDFSQRWHEFLGVGKGFTPFWDVYPTIPLPQQARQTLNISHSSDIAIGQGAQGRPPIRLGNPALKYRLSGPTPPSHTLPIGQFNQYISLHQTRAVNPARDYHPPEDLDAITLLRRPAQSFLPPPSSGDLLLHLLREFLGDSSARFKSNEQREALFHLILNRATCLFLILPTGGGKSLLILLAASLSTSRTTIVVVPLVALKMNLASKAKDAGIDYVIWEESTPDEIYQHSFDLIFVSVETAGTPSFSDMIIHLRAKDQIERVIFDEAHLIYLAIGYRPAMKQLIHLNALGLPLILMSATMSPTTIQGIKETLMLPSSQIVRQNINNPAISYQVQRITSDQTPSDQSFAEQRRQDYLAITHLILTGPQTGKTIVYFMAKSDIHQFYEDQMNRLRQRGFYYYHADLDDQERPRQLDGFIRADQGVLAATGAIGAGYDFQGVSLVIFFNGCYGLTDFVQGSGRSARSPGCHGDAIILLTSRWKPAQQPDPDRHAFDQFIQETQCRRRIINQEFNDIATTHCLSDERKCDLCQQRLDDLAKQSQIARQRVRRVNSDREALLRMIQQWRQGGCLACFLVKPSMFTSLIFITIYI